MYSHVVVVLNIRQTGFLFRRIQEQLRRIKRNQLVRQGSGAALLNLGDSFQEEIQPSPKKKPKKEKPPPKVKVREACAWFEGTGNGELLFCLFSSVYRLYLYSSDPF